MKQISHKIWSCGLRLHDNLGQHVGGIKALFIHSILSLYIFLVAFDEIFEKRHHRPSVSRIEDRFFHSQRDL